MPSTHRKNEPARKEESIRLRLTTSQKEAFLRAADRAGLDLSNWIRATCTAAARDVGTVEQPQG